MVQALSFRDGPIAPVVSASDVVPLTKGSDIGAPTNGYRGLLVGTAGTVNIVTPTGATRLNVPIIVGYNPIRITELLAGGTADNIWGLL